MLTVPRPLWRNKGAADVAIQVLPVSPSLTGTLANVIGVRGSKEVRRTFAKDAITAVSCSPFLIRETVGVPYAPSQVALSRSALTTTFAFHSLFGSLPSRAVVVLVPTFAGHILDVATIGGRYVAFVTISLASRMSIIITAISTDSTFILGQVGR